MTFSCQRDSYLKSLETIVISCTQEIDDDDAENVKKYYIIILEDTILFPEGGGQPCDLGTINSIEVFDVRKRGNQALHYTYRPLKPGKRVTIELDWNRRFDHMQHHTGQHLISAIAEKLFNYSTTSWSLGTDVCCIELECATGVHVNQAQKLEDNVNDRIKECLPITIHLYEKDSAVLDAIHTHYEVPEGYDGPIRVVDIKNVDINACCGTHVRNTSELQMIKLLYSTKGKRGKTNIYFICGNRVLNNLHRCFTLERTMCLLLGTNQDDLPEQIEKLQNSLKEAKKNYVSALRSIASLEASLFLTLDPRPKFYAYHRPSTEDSEFVSVFLNEVDDDEVLFLITCGDGRSFGHITLAGPEELIREHCEFVCAILNGKGLMHNGRFYGKFTKYSNLEDAVNVMKNAVIK